MAGDSTCLTGELRSPLGKGTPRKLNPKHQRLAAPSENDLERPTKKPRAVAVGGDVLLYGTAQANGLPDVHPTGSDDGLGTGNLTSDDEQKEGSPDNLGNLVQAESGQPQEPDARNDKKVLSRKRLQRFKEQSERRGIIYVSRIPPHMKPQKLRQLLSEYGEINRVFCAAEDDTARKARKKSGGNTGKNFTEGWVEFEDKRVAKRVAVMLSGKAMGGSKRSAYYYDLWCLKYLPKFKWDHLTEQIRFERAVREQKLAAEVAAAKRERDFYLSRVDKAKAVDAISQRRQEQGEQQGPNHSREGAAKAIAPAAGTGTTEGAAVPLSASGGKRLLRVYGQKQVKPDPVTGSGASVVADDVLALLAPKRTKQQA